MSYSKYELNSKISSLTAKLTPIIPSPTPGELVVVDKIIVADQYPAPNDTTTITPTSITIATNSTNDISQLDSAQLLMSSTATSNSVSISNSSITLTTADIQFPGVGVSVGNLEFLDTANVLDQDKWTGNIQTVNTVANLTHYLNFSDSSSTGYGYPQKTAGISCNPSTNTITATTFIGSASSSISAVGVNLTSDDTSGTYYLPFSKTTASIANQLYIDNSTTPITYNPLASTLTASVFSGSATTAAITDTNTNATFYPLFVSSAGTAQTLRCDLATGPFSYNPSSGNLAVGGSLTAVRYDGDVKLPTTTAAITSFTAGILTLAIGSGSFRNFGWIVTGAANTMSGLTLTATSVNCVNYVMIINNGTGNLTINTGLTGGTYYLKYTAAVVVPAGGLAVLSINILSVNTITRVVVDAYNVT